MSKPVFSYILGFALSVVLTLIAFGLVSKQSVSGPTLIYVLLGVATLQFIVQLVFFLHMTAESRPWWNAWLLATTISVILIVVLASIWIMNNLKYRHMTGQEQTDYILKSEGIK